MPQAMAMAVEILELKLWSHDFNIYGVGSKRTSTGAIIGSDDIWLFKIGCTGNTMRLVKS